MTTTVQLHAEVVELAKALDQKGTRGFEDKELEVWNQKLMQLPANVGFEVAAELTALGVKLEAAKLPGADLQLAQLALFIKAAMHGQLESGARVERAKQRAVPEKPGTPPPQASNDALWKENKKP